ncbi:hypothetical protein [Bradyrhizobium sp. USDA 3650]
MPTHYKSQLLETAVPWLQVRDRMYLGLQPAARSILTILEFYAERELEPLANGVPLLTDEQAELEPIVAALTVAGVLSQAMRSGTLVATLAQVAKAPDLFYTHELPAAVQWELAQDTQRALEAPGTFSMDVWATENTRVPYTFGRPTEEILASAAARARDRNQEARTPGHPEHPAHRELAERLGPIFRAGKEQIFRQRKKVVRREHGEEFQTYQEGGPFSDFLELVLPPLQDFLRENRLPPVTIAAIVRTAMSHSRDSRSRPPATPDYSHNAKPIYFRTYPKENGHHVMSPHRKGT